MNLISVIVIEMCVFSCLNGLVNGVEIQFPCLLPSLGVNIKAEVLTEMLKGDESKVEAVILPFVDLSGSALMVPKVANLFKDITFVVILSNFRCKGINEYRKSAPNNMRVLTLSVFKGKAQLKHENGFISICPYTVNDYVKLGHINDIVNQVAPKLGYHNYHLFGVGVENVMFFNQMIKYFRSAFAETDFTNIRRIMIVGGTANTCEAMCYALKYFPDVKVDIIVTEVGGNFNKKRRVFRENVKFYWPDVPYTTEFTHEMLGEFNPKLQEIAQSLIELNSNFALDPYCGKLLLAYKTLDGEIEDLMPSTLHVFVRNGK
jgi:hypothetical protein